MNDYKKAKELFVSDTTGSTIAHVNLVSSVALATVLLYFSLLTRSPASSIPFPIACITLVLPLLLSITVFANNPGLLLILLLIPTGIILLVPRKQLGTPLPSPLLMSPNLRPTRPPASTSEDIHRVAPLPFLTVYRAHMLLMTFLAILAVDFPVFPRSLAKCETFGVSLMDLGVGSFVFSQGIVSAIPLLKDPSYLSKPFAPKVLANMRKGLPIMLIGFVRVVLVKGTDYPEHASEYGTHWNFFITLAFLPIMQVALHAIIKRVPIGLVGVMVAVVQQMTLSYFGMQEYIFYAPRTTLISANKEGLISLTGYLAVHLLGLSAGALILPPSPKYFSRVLKGQGQPRKNNQLKVTSRGANLRAPRQNDKTAIELFSYSVVWWFLLGISRLLGIGGDGVSRRMVNIPYIFWVAAFNTSFILGYLLLDLVFFPSRSVYSQRSKLKVPDAMTGQLGGQEEQEQLPLLLEAINKNGLALFLVANLATGMVNLAIPTMYTSDLSAMTILGGYTMGLCATAWVLRDHRLL